MLIYAVRVPDEISIREFNNLIKYLKEFEGRFATEFDENGIRWAKYGIDHKIAVVTRTEENGRTVYKDAFYDLKAELDTYRNTTEEDRKVINKLCMMYHDRDELTITFKSDLLLPEDVLKYALCEGVDVDYIELFVKQDEGSWRYAGNVDKWATCALEDCAKGYKVNEVAYLYPFAYSPQNRSFTDIAMTEEVEDDDGEYVTRVLSKEEFLAKVAESEKERGHKMTVEGL